MLERTPTNQKDQTRQQQENKRKQPDDVVVPALDEMNTPSQAGTFDWANQQPILEFLGNTVKATSVHIVCISGMGAKMHHHILADRRDNLSGNRTVAVLVISVFGRDVILFADVDELGFVQFELHKLDLLECLKRKARSKTSSEAAVAVSEEIKECLVVADIMELRLNKLNYIFPVRYAEKEI